MTYKKPAVLLTILILFHVLFFAIFQYLNKANQTWDSAGHIGMSYLIADKFKLLFSGNGSIVDIIKTSDYYPPLVQTLGAFVSITFGYHSSHLLYLTLIFFILSIWLLYKVVCLITNNNYTLALLSAATFSFLPQIFEQSRVFHLDLPLVAFLLASVYFLIKSNGLKNSLYSLLFFVFVSFAQLTKWYAFVYLFIPFIYLYTDKFTSLGLAGDRATKKLTNLVIGVFLVFVIASPWYFLNLTKLMGYSKIFSTPEIDDPQVLLSVENFTYYVSRMMSFQLSFVPFVLSIVGLVLAFIKNKKLGITVFLSILVPLVVFTLIQNKNLRYIMPLTPLLAVLASYSVYFIAGQLKSLKNIVYGVFIAYLVIGYIFFSFNQIKAESPILKIFGAVYGGTQAKDIYYNPDVYTYEPEYWPVEDVLDFIIEDSGGRGIGITPLFDSKNFSLATFEMLRREKHLNNVYVPVPYFQFEPFENDAAILNYFDTNSVDYVIVPQNAGPEGLRNFSVLTQLSQYFTSSRNTQFVAIKSFTLPDNTVLEVYKRLGVDESTPTERQGNYCIQNAGFGDGVETIKLKENHSYIFYTGHFAIQSLIKKDYTPGVLYIVQIENIPHTSLLDIHNLPSRGTTMCVFENLGVDVSESIRKPLTESGHCGVDCTKVVHVKWSVGTTNIETKEYIRGNF